MITLFCIFIIIAIFVGIIKIFGWLLKAAFHLIPFLIEVFLVIAALYIAWHILSAIGIIVAVAAIVVGCRLVARK